MDWQDPEQRIPITSTYTGVKRGGDGAIESATAIMYSYLLNDFEGTAGAGGSPQQMLEDKWVREGVENTQFDVHAFSYFDFLA